MGCTVVSVDEENATVLCACNHLTNFGVLVVSYQIHINTKIIVYSGEVI